MNGSRGWVRGRMTARPWLAGLTMAAVAAAGLVLSGGSQRAASAADRESSSVTPRPPAATYRIGAATSPRTVLHYRGSISHGVLADSSGADNPGEVTVGDGGRLLSARSRASAHGRQGRAGERNHRYLRFGGRQCMRADGCPWAVVVPRRDLALDDAGTSAFAFGAWVRLTSRPGNAGMTVIQRGSGPTGDAQWSLRVDDGRVSCRWSDGAETAVVPDDLGRSVPLRVDRWYALSCSRQRSRFSLTVVDPVTTWPVASHTKVAPEMGLIPAHGPTTIGATALTGEAGSVTAQFHGDLDEIMVRSG